MSHQSLRAERVDFRYDGSEAAVLTQASLALEPGRRTALLGANGSGKSTLLACLAGSLRPDGGEVLLADTRLRHTRAGLREHRQQVQLVLQDPDDQLFSADVAQDVSFGPLNLGLSEPEVRDRVEEALDLLGIEGLRRKPTHQLSFGEKKRVAIAGAIAMRPCMLLLDEPTAGLDPYGVEELTAALTRLESHGTTVALATHEVAYAAQWADEVAIMTSGQVVSGDAAALLSDRSLLDSARLRPPWALDLAERLIGDDLIATDSRPRTSSQVHEALLSWRGRDHG